jgi:uncharacterized protein YbbC (DUF1343 family)
MELISFRFKNTQLSLVLSLFLSFISCGQNISSQKMDESVEKILPGSTQIENYLPQLSGKKIAIVANHTSTIQTNGIHRHLVDTLISLGVAVEKIFAPEHGFRGKEDASAYIEDGKDSKTGLQILSLHGKRRKPLDADLQNIDAVLFDIQDVGVRFYTYISTMHYVMEACAENNKEMIVLDRPNPNRHYVDGPVMEPENRSFLGMHEVPVVYGMTIGEYARMINGEGWLANGVQCELTVIPNKNYKAESSYSLPIRPSPNLPNDKSINLYPSLGFFEGTPINAGRGTEFQFQRYGAPDFPETEFSYIPQPNFGAKYPKHQNKLCFGVDLRNIPRQNAVNICWLIDAYEKTTDKSAFFGPTFTAHAGTTEMQAQIRAGKSAEEIWNTWQPAIEAFKKIRSKYLIYN